MRTHFNVVRTHFNVVRTHFNVVRTHWVDFCLCPGVETLWLERNKLEKIQNLEVRSRVHCQFVNASVITPQLVVFIRLLFDVYHCTVARGVRNQTGVETAAAVAREETTTTTTTTTTGEVKGALTCMCVRTCVCVCSTD